MSDVSRDWQFVASTAIAAGFAFRSLVKDPTKSVRSAKRGLALGPAVALAGIALRQWGVEHSNKEIRTAAEDLDVAGFAMLPVTAVVGFVLNRAIIGDRTSVSTSRALGLVLSTSVMVPTTTYLVRRSRRIKRDAQRALADAS